MHFHELGGLGLTLPGPPPSGIYDNLPPVIAGGGVYVPRPIVIDIGPPPPPIWPSTPRINPTLPPISTVDWGSLGAPVIAGGGSTVLRPYPSSEGGSVSTTVDTSADKLSLIAQIITTVSQAFGKRPVYDTTPQYGQQQQGQAVTYDSQGNPIYATPDTAGGLVDALSSGAVRLVTEHPLASFSVVGFVLYEVLRKKQGKR